MMSCYVLRLLFACRVP
jgi:outer membrane lipoprotein SlyB